MTRPPNTTAIDNEGQAEKVLYIRVPEVIRDQVKKIAAKHNKTLNKLVREWIEERIGELQELEKMTTRDPNKCWKCGMTTAKGCIEDRYCPLANGS